MFCEKCGKELPEGAKFCEGCGAPVGGAQAKETPKNSFEETVKNLGNTADVTGDFDAADIAKNKVLALFAYIGILFLIPLLAAPNSKFARFHTNQGLVLFITGVIWGVISGIVNLIIGGVPVLVRSLQAMQNCSAVDELIVVTRMSRLEEIAALRDRYGLTKMTKVVVGGMTRAESSLAGVLAASGKATLIGIHDAARPLVTDAIITETIQAAKKSRAAAPGIPVRDTVKLTAGGVITGTPERSALTAIQTPQVFQADLIKAALTNAMRKHLAITDDCSAVEQLRVKPVVTQGSDENLKITTPIDIELAESILRRRGQA